MIPINHRLHSKCHHNDNKSQTAFLKKSFIKSKNSERSIFFSNPRARTHSRRHLLNGVTWLFCSKDAILLRSFTGGRPPAPYAGVRGFFVPLRELPRAFTYVHFRGHVGNVLRLCFEVFARGYVLFLKLGESLSLNNIKTGVLFSL